MNQSSISLGTSKKFSNLETLLKNGSFIGMDNSLLVLFMPLMRKPMVKIEGSDGNHSRVCVTTSIGKSRRISLVNWASRSFGLQLLGGLKLHIAFRCSQVVFSQVVNDCDFHPRRSQSVKTSPTSTDWRLWSRFDPKGRLALQSLIPSKTTVTR